MLINGDDDDSGIAAEDLLDCRAQFLDGGDEQLAGLGRCSLRVLQHLQRQTNVQSCWLLLIFSELRMN